MNEIKALDKNIKLFENQYRTNIQKNNDLINKYIYLGYFCDNQLVAFVSFIYLGDNIDLDYIVVRQENRSKNIATQLLTYLVNNFSFNILNVEVNENNKVAIKVYQKIGFDVINVRGKYYGNDNAIIMQYAKE